MRKDDRYIEVVLELLERDDVPNTRNLKCIIEALKSNMENKKVTKK